MKDNRDFSRMPDSVRESAERLRGVITPEDEPATEVIETPTAPENGKTEEQQAPDGKTVAPDPVIEAPLPAPDGKTEDGQAAPAPERKTEDVEALRAELQHAQQAYRVLEGKYRAEVPRFADEVRNLKNEIESLKQSSKPQPVEQSAAPTNGKTDKDMLDEMSDVALAAEVGWTPEQMDELGGRFVAEGMLLAMRTREKRNQSETFARLEQIQSMTQKAMQPAVESALTGLVKNYDELKGHPDLDRFLEMRDQFSGRTYREHLSEYSAAGDIQGMANVYSVFDTLLEPVESPQKPAEKPAVKPAPNLSSQVQPRPGAPGAPQKTKKTYTEAEWQTAMHELVHDHSHARLEKREELVAARVEGRVGG